MKGMEVSEREMADKDKELRQMNSVLKVITSFSTLIKDFSKSNASLLFHGVSKGSPDLCTKFCNAGREQYPDREYRIASRYKMMNLLALCLIFTSLFAAEVWSQNQSGLKNSKLKML
ncbi:hypothetical protein SADUNF_Sadunf19G0084500 [Salix dunnii]|uniref:Uncharacterized protein n=1 Tax=Salix dunnii TaxID=1413687 RepID=A0A835J4I1_9ROSI|nr:hypothetical protein SADUNF_Sadunf19G0084500 [Salix dunnii]